VAESEKHPDSEKYPNLLREKGGKGFPHLAFLDSEGGVLLPHKGERSVASFGETAKKVAAYLDLKARAGKGDKKAQCEVFLVQMELKLVRFDEAKKRREELDKELSADQKKKYEGLLVGLEVASMLEKVNMRDKAALIETGKKFLEMKKAGRIPVGGDEEINFWVIILEYCEDQKDAATYEEALGVVKKKLGARANKRWLEQKEATLKKLKETK